MLPGVSEASSGAAVYRNEEVTLTAPVHEMQGLLDRGPAGRARYRLGVGLSGGGLQSDQEPVPFGGPHRLCRARAGPPSVSFHAAAGRLSCITARDGFKVARAGTKKAGHFGPARYRFRLQEPKLWGGHRGKRASVPRRTIRGSLEDSTNKRGPAAAAEEEALLGFRGVERQGSG